MEMRVLRPETRLFFFLPQQVAAQDDSGVAEGVGLLTAGGEEAGVATEVPIAVAAGGGGGVAGPRTT
jgi:hypothetical protein